MRRREFIGFVGGAALVGMPVPLIAQDVGRIYRLGALIPSAREAPPIIAFFDELRLLGFIEGQNLTVISGGFGVSNDGLPERAKALVAVAPDVIISGPDNYARALQQATRAIPIVV